MFAEQTCEQHWAAVASVHSPPGGVQTPPVQVAASLTWRLLAEEKFWPSVE